MTAAAGHLVCFDLGGVVLRICRTWREGCQAAGVAYRGDVHTPDGQRERLGELHSLHQLGRLDLPTFAVRFSDIVDGLYSNEEVIAIHDAWIVGEYEGIAALIDRIHRAGLETAVLSNTTREHWLMMKRFTAWRALRNRHGSHELALRKPDEAIYHALSEKTGFEGGDIIFFDDLEDNVIGAREAGWTAEQIDPMGDTARQVADALAARGILR